MRERNLSSHADDESNANTAAFSSNWRAVARGNGFDTTIEVEETIRFAPDPISSSVEHAAARQLRKHLRGVSS
jgi:hypothetical protein